MSTGNAKKKICHAGRPFRPPTPPRHRLASAALACENIPMKRIIRACLLPVLLSLNVTTLHAQEEAPKRAMKTADEAIAEGEARLAALGSSLATLYYQRGEDHFFAGRINQAVADWDREIELAPRRDPHHWQRGLALYYAGRFEDGAKQFERHQIVNGTDVENAAWHYLCLSRHKTPAEALKALYPFAGDRRRPMREIHGLFAGTKTPEEVVKACADNRNALCYGHLYIGIHHEANGRNEEAFPHFKQAALDFGMDHYMGKVAKFHYEGVRKGVPEAE